MATERGRDSSSRESSIFELPKYEILYGEDHTLQWNPPAGSKELAVALSYHFPMGDLESKMRAATKGFLKAEAKKDLERYRGTHRRSSHRQFSEENVLKSSLQQPKVMNASSRSNNKSPINIAIESEHQDSGHTPPTTDVGVSPDPHQELEFVSWKPEILGFKKVAPKRRYEKDEREKVAANRGYACEEHRRRKLNCDPGECLNNKQNLKNAWEPLPGDPIKAETTSQTTSGPTSGAQLASMYNDLGREVGVPADTLSSSDHYLNSSNISKLGTFTSPSNSRWSADRDDTIQPSLLNLRRIWDHPVDTIVTLGPKDQLEKVEENDAISYQVADKASESIISWVDLGVTSPDPVSVHNSFLTDSEPGWLLDDFGFRDDVLLHHDNDGESGVAFSRHLLPGPASNTVWSPIWDFAPHVGETCATIMTEALGLGENENDTKHDEQIEPNPTPKPVLCKKKWRNRAASRKDDWLDIQDPEERRRVQSRIAQRKFRDKAKEAKERQDREAKNRVDVGNSYQSPYPDEIGADEELSGLPWGSISLKHAVKKGKSNENRSDYASEPDYEDTNAYFEGDSTHYEEGDRAYYDYGTLSLDLDNNRVSSKTASRDKTVSDGKTEDDGQDPRASDGASDADQLANGLKFLEISVKIKHEELC